MKECMRATSLEWGFQVHIREVVENISGHFAVRKAMKAFRALGDSVRHRLLGLLEQGLAHNACVQRFLNIHLLIPEYQRVLQPMPRASGGRAQRRVYVEDSASGESNIFHHFGLVWQHLKIYHIIS